MGQEGQRDIAGLWESEVLAECESYELVGAANTAESRRNPWCRCLRLGHRPEEVVAALVIDLSRQGPVTLALAAHVER